MTDPTTDRTTGPTRPPEPPGGQDGPPNLYMALVATLALLHDVREHLEAEHLPDPGDLLLRIGAVGAVLNRLREEHHDGLWP